MNMCEMKNTLVRNNGRLDIAVEKIVTLKQQLKLSKMKHTENERSFKKVNRSSVSCGTASSSLKYLYSESSKERERGGQKLLGNSSCNNPESPETQWPWWPWRRRWRKKDRSWIEGHPTHRNHDGIGQPCDKIFKKPYNFIISLTDSKLSWLYRPTKDILLTFLENGDCTPKWTGNFFLQILLMLPALGGVVTERCSAGTSDLEQQTHWGVFSLPLHIVKWPYVSE